MGLTLVTGPANSAKAALVLERYRAALARAAILVVPRARRRRALPARARRGWPPFWASRSEPFGGLIARAGAARRHPSRVRSRSPRGSGILAAVVGDADLPACSPPRGDGARVRARAGALRRRARGAARRARAAAGGTAGTGRRRRPGAGATARSWRASTPATAAALERLGLLDAELHAVARAGRAAHSPPDRWGAHAGLLLRLRRPRAAPARRDRDARPSRRRSGHAVASERARARRPGGAGGDARDAARRRRGGDRPGPARHLLRGRDAPPPRARAVRGRAGAGLARPTRCGCSKAATSGRRPS